MSEEYEIIFITEEGRAIKNNKTGKIYHSEFEIIEEKDKEIDRLNNIIDELEEYIKPYLYMLNGIQDRDIYEQCQLDDFTNIMEKLQELKENNEDEC